MSRGGSSGVRVPDGEVQVQRVDKIVVVTPPEKKAGDVEVDDIAWDFIRMKKKAFQGGNKPAVQAPMG
ncbi:hypothetical protein E2562_003410 [Oryza meyeriana var. granulata]|uniref:Uncharacterized protein n=1 Tax=Oryza meyeriana var. granulata TaxID=110450 RepID=A0A6G1EEM0_9ORYZ|nr:hypothetical protein E2562_003410 [Oryza meyeriana var. granulata]